MFASTGQGIIGANMFAYCGNNPVRGIDKSGTTFLYDLWNKTEDGMWKFGSNILRLFGFYLTGDLMNLAASGSGNKYSASSNSYAAQLISSDKGFVSDVKDAISSNGPSGNDYYEFPVSNGDLGAALHNVSYAYEVLPNSTANNTSVAVTVRDTFDFTECKSPFRQGSFKAGVLWLANDVAYYDTRWGLLDPVDVEINVIISIEP